MSDITLYELIYDRVQADVTNKTSKGYYNASDLNRVESWCRYLADELNRVGYNINITTKTNWTTSDFRTSSNMMRIRNNIKAIVNAFHSLTSVGSVVNNWDYKKANNWEKVLWEIYSLMWGAEDWYVYGGVARGGQPRLWQHRFRQFFDPVRIVVAGELLTTENGDALSTESGVDLEVENI